MAKIKNSSLGSQGVILDPHHLLPGVSPEGMTLAQNFYHDANAGFGGALRKRPGFQKFNPLNMGGVILGGIGMPVAGNGSAVGGGAPIGTGDSADGTSVGTGDGTGLPGATFDGSAAPVFTPPSVGAALFATPGLFGGARLIIVGRGSNQGAIGSYGRGWYVSSKGLADVAVNVDLTPGPPGVVYSYPPTVVFPGAMGNPSIYHAASGYMYYAKNHDQPSGTVTEIRKVNGATDSLVATVALSSAAAAYSNGVIATGANRQHITGMHLGSDGFIYMSLKDRAGGQDVNDLNYGRILKMNVSTGTYAELTMTDPAILPYECVFFDGKVFWGTFNLASSEVAAGLTSAVIYVTNADFTGSTIDTGLATAAGGSVITSMLPFPAGDVPNQILFAGIGCNGVAFSYVIARQRNAASALPWSTGISTNIGSGGAATAGNYFPSLVEFNGNMYASFYNPGQTSKIYKFVPNYGALASDGFWDGTGTWSTVFTGAGTFRPYNLFVDDGVIYAIGSIGFGSAASALVSTDGTTWTDKSASLPAGGSQNFPLPILTGFNQ